MAGLVLGAPLDLARALRCFVFGHATYEHTAAAVSRSDRQGVLYEVTADWLCRRCPGNWRISTGAWPASWRPDDTARAPCTRCR
jgi:hypothetical protein